MVIYRGAKHKIQFMFENKSDIFFNLNKPFSYKNVFFYLLMGGRGIGKTTAIQFHILKQWANYEKQFVIVKRYKTEIQAFKTYFDKICPSVKTKNICEFVFDYRIGDKTIGYCIPLSKQQDLKSVGIDFTKVNAIIFDDAFLTNYGTKRYLPNEVHELFELISTIVRERDNYKVILSGNNVALFNPYFEYFDIPTNRKIYVDLDRRIYAQVIDSNPKIHEIYEKTPLYALTKNTAYGEYHYDNKTLTTETKIPIGVKDMNATLLYRLVINNTTLNVYIQGKGTLFIEYRDKIIEDGQTYKMFKDNNLNYYFVRQFKQTRYYNSLLYCLMYNLVFCDNDKVSAMLETLLNKIK